METQKKETIRTLTEGYEAKMARLNIARDTTIDIIDAIILLSSIQRHLAKELQERYIDTGIADQTGE